MLAYTEYAKMMIGLIAIVNPIGAVPIFITLTSHLDMTERRAISNLTGSRYWPSCFCPCFSVRLLCVFSA
jgi:small neutral amino acid transporter SnatA (MarC family)